jgi:predicted nucleotidyltransferase
MVRPLRVAGTPFVVRPLDVVLGAPSHIAVLRALRHAVGGLTGREVARQARIAPCAAMGSLGRLESAGVVRRRPAGRAYLFELCGNRLLVKEGLLPLLDLEARMRGRAREILAKAFGREVVSAVIFGSVARGEDRPESDMDLCLVVERPQDKDRASGQAGAASSALAEELGITLSAILFTRSEFVQGYRRQEEFYRNVVREGERVSGRDLGEVVDGRGDTPDAGRSKPRGKPRRRRE